MAGWGRKNSLVMCHDGGVECMCPLRHVQESTWADALSPPRGKLLIRAIQMAAAKRQQANGAKKCENGRPKRSETESKNERKSTSKTSENRQKSAKTIGMLFGDRFLAIFRRPHSGGHLGFP